MWPCSPAGLALAWHVAAAGMSIITEGGGHTAGLQGPHELDDKERGKVDAMLRSPGYPLHIAGQLMGSGLPPPLS